MSRAVTGTHKVVKKNIPTFSFFLQIFFVLVSHQGKTVLIQKKMHFSTSPNQMGLVEYPYLTFLMYKWSHMTEQALEHYLNVVSKLNFSFYLVLKMNYII